MQPNKGKKEKERKGNYEKISREAVSTQCESPQLLQQTETREFLLLSHSGNLQDDNVNY